MKDPSVARGGATYVLTGKTISRNNGEKKWFHSEKPVRKPG